MMEKGYKSCNHLKKTLVYYLQISNAPHLVDVIFWFMEVWSKKTSNQKQTNVQITVVNVEANYDESGH